MGNVDEDLVDQGTFFMNLEQFDNSELWCIEQYTFRIVPFKCVVLDNPIISVPGFVFSITTYSFDIRRCSSKILQAIQSTDTNDHRCRGIFGAIVELAVRMRQRQYQEEERSRRKEAQELKELKESTETPASTSGLQMVLGPELPTTEELEDIFVDYGDATEGQ